MTLKDKHKQIKAVVSSAFEHKPFTIPCLPHIKAVEITLQTEGYCYRIEDNKGKVSFCVKSPHVKLYLLTLKGIRRHLANSLIDFHL